MEAGRIVHKGVAYAAEHQAIIAVEVFEPAQKLLAAHPNVHAQASSEAIRLAMAFDSLRRVRQLGHAGMDHESRPRVPLLHMLQEGKDRLL